MVVLAEGNLVRRQSKAKRVRGNIYRGLNTPKGGGRGEPSGMLLASGERYRATCGETRKW